MVIGLVDLEIILRLLVSIVLGALVGYERELTHKPAGLRTHMLVSLGACLFTVIAITQFSSDSARIISGIVTGIGFIGAGSIIAKGRVQGITTAASIWVVAGVGIASGIGAYLFAAVTAILVFVILEFKRFEKFK